MLPFLFKKLLNLVPTLIGVSFLSFFLIRMVPGDPVMLLLGERGANPEIYQAMKKEMGLDKPLTTQYILYMKNAVQGNLGNSLITKRSVTNEFFARFPATIELGVCALIFATIFGIPAGIIAALKRNSPYDYFIMGTSLAGYSMPIFWWGLLLIMGFSVALGMTPVSGRINILFDIDHTTGFYLLDTLAPKVLRSEGLLPFASALRHLILPSIAMGTIPLAVIARMTRSSMLEVLNQDYIRTANAKGLPSSKVVLKHGLRNALIPIVTVIGLLFGSIITGAILTETIFSWPGIGKWLVSSINGRDYPVIQGAILFIATLVVIINLLVDTAYLILNPKIEKS